MTDKSPEPSQKEQVRSQEAITAQLEGLIETPPVLNIPSNRNSIDSILSLYSHSRTDSQMIAAIEGLSYGPDATLTTHPVAEDGHQHSPNQHGYENYDTVQYNSDHGEEEQFDTIRELWNSLTSLQQNMDELLTEHAPRHACAHSAPANLPHYVSTGLNFSQYSTNFMAMPIIEEKSKDNVGADDSTSRSELTKHDSDISEQLNDDFIANLSATTSEATKHDRNRVVMEANQSFISSDFWACSEAEDDEHASSVEHQVEVPASSRASDFILDRAVDHMDTLLNAHCSTIEEDDEVPVSFNLTDFDLHADRDEIAELVCMSTLCLMCIMVYMTGVA